MPSFLAKPYTEHPSIKPLPMFCLFLTPASAAFADVTHDVRCREIGFSQSAEMQDAALFKSFIDADARFVGNAVTRGPSAIIAAWSVFFAADGPGDSD